MATRLRFVLSAANKVARCHKRLQPVQKTVLSVSAHESISARSISSAVLTQFGRVAPTLTGVRPSWSRQPQRRLQTEVDKELSKFLEKEISYEESASGKSQVKGIEGFDVDKKDADVTLTRRSGDETVVVKFNINSSVDAEGPLQEGDQSSEMVSRPPFTVELCKGDGQTLSLHCNFVAPDDMDAQDGPQGAEAIVDTFEIQEASLHKGEMSDSTYSVPADIMDGNLYDLLMDMLDERGINEEFANQLLEFSTSYEHSRYLNFLKNLKSFSEK